VAAYAWEIEAGEVGVSKEILAANEYRDELLVQLHTQVVPGASPVFVAFGEEATTENGLMLGGIGHTVRPLGAKSRLSVNVLSAAASAGGIETHTSLEYRHVLNYPLWQKQEPKGEAPICVHFSPLDDTDDAPVDWDPFFLMFDMNVQAGTGDIVLHLAGDDSVVETIAIGDATVDGGIVEFSLTNPLDAGTAYYFLIASGVIESEEGVDWGGTDDETTWNFVTAA